ncbi:MAG: hypothetical protein KKF68_02225 [Nanoarchaeota archaeon]|nr:hypothetical protein [Nanoarchaeota archaeon]
MNLQFYFEKLNVSEDFKKFKKENPDAFLCSGFFVIDKVGTDNQQHFDFYVPSSNEIYSFKGENNGEKIPSERTEQKIPEKVSINYLITFEEVEKIIQDRMLKEKINSKIQKILLSLQKLNGKDFFVGTVFVSMLGMVKIHLDLVKKEIVLFEKKSFFDIVNVLKK